MAPELFEEGRELTLNDMKAVDVWAAGVLAFYLLTGADYFPFDSEDDETEENQEEIRNQITRAICEDSPEEKIQELVIEPMAKDFIRCCLEKDPS